MKVRRAERGDLRRLLELYGEPGELYGEVRGVDAQEAGRLFEAVLADEHQLTLVAEEGGEVVGTLVVAMLPNLAHGGAPYAVVENVVVDGSRRGEGIGRLLMLDALRRAREAEAYKLTLSSNAAREMAHAFYRRLGLRETHAGFEVGP